MGEIKIGRMVLSVCQTNCYFLYRDGEHEAIVVDPADKGTVCSYTLSWETSSTAATVTEDIIYQAVFTSASHHFATGWSSLG